MARIALVLLLATSASGARIVGSGRQGSALPKRQAQRFCASEDLKMSCDEHSVIKVYSAFYNHRDFKKCGASVAGGEESCDANFTEKVLFCEGEHECVVPATQHSHCAKKPYSGVRAVWSCVPGVSVKSLEEPEVKEEVAIEESANPHAAEPGASSPKESVPTVDEDDNIRYAKDFCLSKWLHLTCEDGWRIEPVSAIYETKDTETCKQPTDVDCDDMDCSCDHNATQMVYDRCAGGRYAQTCVLPPSVHRLCQQQPFTFLRVLWDCVKGNERTRSSAADSVA